MISINADKLCTIPVLSSSGAYRANGKTFRIFDRLDQTALIGDAFPTKSMAVAVGDGGTNS